MSRHDLFAFSKQFNVTVGWDRPMNTFFAQVEDLKVSDDDGDPIIVWVGTSHSEFLRPEDLQPHIAAYATIPEETLVVLRADRTATLDRGNSQLQREIRRLTEGDKNSSEEE